MSKPLTVYKASAGSGKTFRLAVEYIKLLINNPQAYRSILAVTFTNKATEEMKNRILGQLYGIWKQLPSSEPYINCVTQEMGVGRELASAQAHTALSNLIHHYSYFRVETIDAFFQSVLRNLARELELTSNMRIVINDKQVEQQAVDELIENLNTKSEELNWILDYIRDNIEEDKGWNVIQMIKNFGENIFKDIYKAEGAAVNEKLNEKDFFKTFSRKVREIKTEAEKKLKQPAERFFEIIEHNGVNVTDFSNGASGVPSYFLKLQAGKYKTDDLLLTRVIAGMESANQWVKKADQKASSPLLALVESELLPLLLKSEEERPKWFRLFKSADITLRHLNQLRLLNSIDQYVRNLNRDTNRFLLSDTQTLLRSLIQDSDTPFIYEKIGTQLEHIMIDEFQDTSTVQWRNFKILLKECLSHSGSHNLIVGDVKQSIYRWRSGDWRLLNDIESEFTPTQVDVQNMQFNRRSAVRVINFNNAFFRAAASAEYQMLQQENPSEAEQVERAYCNLEQISPHTNQPATGYVRVELLPKANYHANMIERLGNTIDEMLAAGIEPHQIAIIVRYNYTIQEIADHFMQTRPHVKMVSEEAFRLDSSLAVNMLIDALRVLDHPENLLNKAQLAKAYQLHILDSGKQESEMLLKGLELSTLLPSAFNDRMERLVAQPLTDLIEQLYAIFNLSRLDGQSAYVCAFFDLVHTFVDEHTPDIEEFLNAWDETLHENTIQSAGTDGIRLITIHKSKGLEFKHVVMPFCDWQMIKETLIWCKPAADAAPFNQLPLIPVDFNKQLQTSIYEADYLHEHLQNTVDNLNLLYVAFTRAEFSLRVMGKRNDENLRSHIIQKCINHVKDALPESTLSETDEESIVFEYGEPYQIEATADADTDAEKESQAKHQVNVFTERPQQKQLRVETFPRHAEFRQSNQSRDFVSQHSDEPDQRQAYMQMGTVLHNLFSTIRTTDDIPTALHQLESQGILYDRDISREKLTQLISQRLNNPRVANWFSPKWQLFNECTILGIDPETGKTFQQRPDRVMTDDNEMIVVDFKFGSPRPDLLDKYQKQVRRYMALLSDMGYQNISGFLWFVYSNRIVSVEP